jgi:hypothetical protein
VAGQTLVSLEPSVRSRRAPGRACYESLIVLVTTNDDLRQLHPAVSRPGRCLAKIEFVPFTPKEAEVGATACTGPTATA